MENIEMSPELGTLKTKMRATWVAGDYGQIAKTSAKCGEDFIERLNLQPGTRVLDAACGTGNLSIPAARKGAIVTGLDLAPNLLEQARARAEAEGLEIQFDEGDVENLPYADAEFDAVVSMYGAMFAPRPDVTAAELKRVCRPGGFIAMGNWVPDGFVAEMFKANTKYVTPPDVPPPLLWGDEATLRERFREGISDLKMTRRIFNCKFPFSPAEVVEHFRTFFGPTKVSFEALDEQEQASLRRDLEELWTRHNKATDGTTEADLEYLEVVAVRA
jgi:ubiquinone/menaquinone biosynthesis C-methylase UbiE